MSKDIATIYDWARMCKAIEDDCERCPIHNLTDGTRACFFYMMDCPKESSEIILKWCEEHPIKTYLTDFREKLPNALFMEGGTPRACRRFLYGIECPKYTSVTTCAECWNEPMEV